MEKIEFKFFCCIVGNIISVGFVFGGFWVFWFNNIGSYVEKGIDVFELFSVMLCEVVVGCC